MLEGKTISEVMQLAAVTARTSLLLNWLTMTVNKNAATAWENYMGKQESNRWHCMVSDYRAQSLPQEWGPKH